MNLHRNIRTILVSLLVVIVVLYTLYASRSIILGPQLIVHEPTDGAIIATSTITIRGITPQAKTLTLNDQPITVDEIGNFSEIRLLEPGTNVYKLFITDRFGRTNQKILRIYRQYTF